MFETQLRLRALAFACVAAVVLMTVVLLARVGWPPKLPTLTEFYWAIGVAFFGGLAVFSTIITAISPVVDAIQRITESVRPRREGDPIPAIPPSARRELPKLVAAVSLFRRRIQTNIDSIQKTALLDSVTELPNRMSFRRSVERYLRSTRISNASCAIVFIDLDRFKSVNDSLGHAQGDLLLAMFAARMRVLVSAWSARRGTHSNHEPVLARLAGDEFTMLLPDIQSVDEATKLTRQVLRALEDPFELAGQSIVLGASMGICIAPADGDDYDTLIRNADTAMYHAKDCGRNRYHLFEAAMHERVRDRLHLESKLRAAIAHNEFELFMQPQIRADTGELVSAEALIRWHHPEKGLSAPGAFIDIAEDSGLIVDIGKWVIEEAVRIVTEWYHKGRKLKLSFNVSPQQIERADFVNHLSATVQALNAPAHLLEIEITESTVMSSDPVIVERIAAARKLGLSIAIDDFGTGYSNLARLKDMPIDRLKIDRSLVNDVAISADSRTIIQAIVGLAKGLGYDCVAEGIETEVQADILGVMGCEILQGYWISKPIDGTAFLNWADDRLERASAGERV